MRHVGDVTDEMSCILLAFGTKTTKTSCLLHIKHLADPLTGWFQSNTKIYSADQCSLYVWSSESFVLSHMSSGPLLDDSDHAGPLELA